MREAERKHEASIRHYRPMTKTVTLVISLRERFCNQNSYRAEIGALRIETLLLCSHERLLWKVPYGHVGALSESEICDRFSDHENEGDNHHFS